MEKICQVCGMREKPGNLVLPYTLLNGSVIFTDKDCLNIDVLESFFQENLGSDDNIDLEMASKVLKDKLKRRKIQNEGMSAYYRGRR